MFTDGMMISNGNAKYSELVIVVTRLMSADKAVEIVGSLQVLEP